MSKVITDFLDNKGYLIQKDASRQNMIDSNFLTSNMLYQKALLGDHSWFNGNVLPWVARNVKDDYRTPEGSIRRYYKDFTGDQVPIGADEAETSRYTNPNHVSRDNSLGFIMMLGKFGYRKAARSLLYKILLRGSFFQNTHTVSGTKKFLPDLCGLEQYSIILRACFTPPILLLLLPLLLVTDLFFLLSIAVHVVKSYYDPTHTSTCLHELSAVAQAKDTFDTPFTILARYLFLNKRRPVPEFPDKEPIVSALKYYSRFTYDPPIFETSSRLVDQLKNK